MNGCTAKYWFMTFGMKPGYDLKTLINALDKRFIKKAKSSCCELEAQYVDQCVAFQQEQLNKLRNILLD